jgi:hypothetical protein
MNTVQGNDTMSRHFHFIDWLKAVGMLLILLGHVFGGHDILFNQISAPVYTKQLGVAFFVFITGWSLANDKRQPIRIVFNRLFPIYFFGVSCALAITLIALATGGDPNESNYLPFLLGISVFQNYFPANPTTWYFGMYIHLILFWYLFISYRTVKVKHVAIGLLAEILVRALLIDLDVKMIAYMVVPNWITPFLLGACLKHRSDRPWQLQSTVLAITWIAVLACWAYFQRALSFQGGFPFLSFPPSEAPVNNHLSTLVSSALISIIYSVNTLIAFELARRLPLPKIVAFLARNTLLTVILHMPLIYAYAGGFYGLIEDPTLKRLAFVFVLYISLSLFSELIHKVIPLNKLSRFSWQLCKRPLMWLDAARPQRHARSLSQAGSG